MNIGELTCKELVEVVTDYLEERMRAENRLRFEEHVAVCDGCTTYLAQMRDTIRATGTLREDDLSSDARDALLEVFRDWKGADALDGVIIRTDQSGMPATPA